MKNVFGNPATRPQATVSPEIAEVNDVENRASDEKPQPNAQEGIQKVEAVTLLWTKKELIVAYLL